MILITGAGGKTGQALVRALAARGEAVRAMVRRDEQVPALRSLGATEIVVADLHRGEDLRLACRGVDTVYLICPNMQPNEFEIAQTVLAAAKAEGVTRLVYHSVLHPQTQAMPHHWQKLRVEELLFTSGINHTILQPAAYMQNVLAQWPTIVQTGIYRVPYTPETRLGMVDLRDVAHAAATVLIEDEHDGATYELCGPQMLTQHDVAAILTTTLGHPVRAQAQSRAEWAHNAARAGLSGYALSTLVAMFEYYERHGFGGNPNVLAMLLGQAPSTFAQFAHRVVDG